MPTKNVLKQYDSHHISKKFLWFHIQLSKSPTILAREHAFLDATSRVFFFPARAAPAPDETAALNAAGVVADPKDGDGAGAMDSLSTGVTPAGVWFFENKWVAWSRRAPSLGLVHYGSVQPGQKPGRKFFSRVFADSARGFWWVGG